MQFRSQVSYLTDACGEEGWNKVIMILVLQSSDSQSVARDTPLCARSTLDIMVQVR